MNFGRIFAVIGGVVATIMLMVCLISIEKVPAGYRGVRVKL